MKKNKKKMLRNCNDQIKFEIRKCLLYPSRTLNKTDSLSRHQELPGAFLFLFHKLSPIAFSGNGTDCVCIKF